MASMFGVEFRHLPLAHGGDADAKRLQEAGVEAILEVNDRAFQTFQMFVPVTTVMVFVTVNPYSFLSALYYVLIGVTWADRKRFIGQL